MGERQQWIPCRFALDDPLAGLSKLRGVEVGIQATGAVPEHRLLAVLGVLEVDPVPQQVLPKALQVEALMKEPEHGEGIQQLLLPLIHQVFAVGIEHDAVTLEHIHHLQQMVRCVLEQWRIAEQAPDQLLLIRQLGWSHCRGLQGGGHESPPLI